MAEDSVENLAGKLAEEASAVQKDSAKSSDSSSSSLGAGKDRNLALILDIPLRVTVELGRTKMPVNELLNLTQGSVVELSKLAGEPMEVYVNDKLIAKGEAVVVNEKFGVRLTDIISPSERVESLK
jgi:flagellar motor switch protein FliN/FliY